MIINRWMLFSDFFDNEKTGGLILIFCTAISISVANLSSVGNDYSAFWQRHIDLSLFNIDLNYSIERFINDGLMALFFLFVGLEIKREFYKGELSDVRHALLPIAAALGGMVVPALIHLSFNIGTPTQSGFGIPMATDIAFSLGVLSLMGSKIPSSLKVFLTALAIMDDLGAVIIIALFYTNGIFVLYLGAAMTIFGVLFALNRLGVTNLMFYILPGMVMWYFMLKSGVHATIAGVLLAFAIPFRNGDQHSPSSLMLKFLNKPVPFLILPIFAIANTCIIFSSDWYLSLTASNNMGIMAGLVLGKPLGILLFSLIAVRMGICKIPRDLNLCHLIGGGVLAGIGFTISIFIADIAFAEGILITNSKVAILTASSIAGVAGFLFLSVTAKTPCCRSLLKKDAR